MTISVEQRLGAMINQVLQRANKPTVDELRRDAQLQQDLGLDSLELAELTVLLEAEFGVDIFEDGLVRTVGEVLAKLERASDGAPRSE